LISFLGLLTLCFLAAPARAAVTSPDYVIVASKATLGNESWRRVVDTLQKKHAGKVIFYDQSVAETHSKLRELSPRYACFVARPSEATRAFVAEVHRLARNFNDDPYPDCFWGILTGYDAANALRIATHSEPLTVRKVASGTEVALDMCEEGIWYCELKAGKWVQKKKGGKPEQSQGPTDTTEALAKTLTDYHADLFVTSGHATERDWQIGYSYRNGSFRCENGALYGLDTKKQKFPIVSPNPKVYLPIGNCLMGHIDDTNAMALAFMNSGGVNQMIGYTVTSWYGYAGWGCLDYFVEQPGRYTFTEAFFANQVALIHRLQTYFPDLVSAELDTNFQPKAPVQVTEAARNASLKSQDAVGLLYDRDTVAFYGDPAWIARMADQPRAYEQTLAIDGDKFTLDIKPNRAADSFKAVNTNGSQRGGRPFIAWLPCRIADPKLVEGSDLKPLVAPRFVLVPNPGQCDPAKSYRVVFTARRLE
jgi:zinc protease